MDTAILFAGMLTAAQYFDSRFGGRGRDPRARGDALRPSRLDLVAERRPDDQPRMEARVRLPALRLGGLQRGAAALRPRSWLYRLHARRRTTIVPGLRPISGRTSTGRDLLYAGPLFIHQFSHVWIDFRGIHDAFMREKHPTTSRTAGGPYGCSGSTPCSNPRGFRGYGPRSWGITACDGPGPATQPSTAASSGSSDTPRAACLTDRMMARSPPRRAVASLPFAPDIVLPTLEHVCDAVPEAATELGLKCFNPSFPSAGRQRLGISGELRDRPGSGRPDDREPPFVGSLWDLLRRDRHVAARTAPRGIPGGAG